MEVTDREQARLGPIEFAQLRERDRADGDVDAHAKRVRAADDFEQAGLRQLLDHEAIFREHPCVVDAHAVMDPALQVLAERRVKAEAAKLAFDVLLLLLREDVRAHKVLRTLGRRTLSEVHQVDGGAVTLHEFADSVEQRRLAILELQGHGPLGRAHHFDWRRRDQREALFDDPRVAQRGAH